MKPKDNSSKIQKPAAAESSKYQNSGYGNPKHAPNHVHRRRKSSRYLSCHQWCPHWNLLYVLDRKTKFESFPLQWCKPDICINEHA